MIKNKIYCGDSLEKLKELENESIDAVVCDPPYELGFMGKKWDASGIAYNVDLWKECFRVLKPGGHLIAFGGTRTYHRMAVAIEDAGFEIRDMLEWIYASGFPKSHNISKQMSKVKNIPLCTCKEHEPMIQLGYENNTTNNQGIGNNDGFGSGEKVRAERNDNNEVEKQIEDTDISLKVSNEAGSEVQSLWKESNEATKGHKKVAKPILREGLCGSISEKKRYGDVEIRERLETDKGESESEGQSLSSMRESGSATSSSPCAVQNGGQECKREPNRIMQELPQQGGEINGKGNRQSKNDGKNNKWGIDNKFICPKCGNLRKDLGGSAIKPAHEPICMARKPLSEKTIVENVLKHGTGGLNIDGCRIPTSEENRRTVAGFNSKSEIYNNDEKYKINTFENNEPTGRFPANIIVSDDALNDGEITKSSDTKRTRQTIGSFGMPNDTTPEYSDSGSKSRYFDIDHWATKYGLLQYPKASKRERNEGCEGLELKEIYPQNNSIERKELNSTVNKRVSNNHPTVKPVHLMAWLIKLVSKENDIVLDPFMGSGTTGVACKKLNRNFIGIELSEEYCEIARERLKQQTLF